MMDTKSFFLVSSGWSVLKSHEQSVRTRKEDDLSIQVSTVITDRVRKKEEASALQ